jgi:hypothetical protein
MSVNRVTVQVDAVLPGFIKQTIRQTRPYIPLATSDRSNRIKGFSCEYGLG